MSVRPFAFVLMPFTPDFDDIYKLGIKSTCEGAGFLAERVDEQRFSENILERIYRQISAADLVVADMTGRNPNVFYEVGYAHALEKRCVLLTADADDIPFDLKHHRHIIYGHSISKLCEGLSQELIWQKQEIDSRKAKTITAEVKRIFGNLVLSSFSARGDVDIDIDLKNVSSNRIKEVEAIYLHTGPDWKYFQQGNVCPQDVSDLEDYAERHFLSSPVSSLSQGAWAPLKLIGKKQLGYSFDGEELKKSYRISGHITIEVITSQGSFREKLDLDVVIDEIPF